VKYAQKASLVFLVTASSLSRTLRTGTMHYWTMMITTFETNMPRCHPNFTTQVEANLSIGLHIMEVIASLLDVCSKIQLF
jgi:hypothetical protein